MELIEADLKMASKMFEILSNSAAIDGVTSVEIIFKTDGGDTITVGYGEQGEPAILNIEAK